MKELDCIEVIVEKKKYTEDGVHKGMTGWICYDKCVDGYWLVNFPQYGEKPDIVTIGVHESDMVNVATLDVRMDFYKVSLGFGMALAMNANALNAYSATTEAQKQAILDKAHNARSEQEMHQIVNSLIK